MTTIEYEGKKYTFSWHSILYFAIFSPIIAFVIYYLTEVFWEFTHEPVVSQTVWLINILNLMKPDLITYQKYFYQFKFIIPTQGVIGFETMCTGVQAIAIFAGVIIMTPHSTDKEANKNIWPRKIFSLIVASALFYSVNIIRMVIQLTLYYNGSNWEDIHTSISAASSFIAAIIIILMHRWIPEFIISIIWMIGDAKSFFQSRKGTIKTEIVEEKQNPEDEPKIDCPESDIIKK